MIIENILNKAYQKLNNANIRNANLDCEILLSNIINQKREYVILNSKKSLDKKNVNIFNNLIERRKKGEPVAYLINEKEFWKETFYVDNTVLIPRPDTELLIESVMKYTKRDSKLHVLDIGTGSGAIILAMASQLRDLDFYGMDFSQKAISVASINALNLKEMFLKRKHRLLLLRFPW